MLFEEDEETYVCEYCGSTIEYGFSCCCYEMDAAEFGQYGDEEFDIE